MNRIKLPNFLEYRVELLVIVNSQKINLNDHKGQNKRFIELQTHQQNLVAKIFKKDI